MSVFSKKTKESSLKGRFWTRLGPGGQVGKLGSWAADGQQSLQLADHLKLGESNFFGVEHGRTCFVHKLGRANACFFEKPVVNMSNGFVIFLVP